LAIAALLSAAGQTGSAGPPVGVFDVANAVLVKTGIDGFPYFWDGERFAPAPVVYLVRWEDSLWLESGDGAKYPEVLLPVVEGPYLAVPRSALNVTPPRDVWLAAESGLGDCAQPPGGQRGSA